MNTNFTENQSWNKNKRFHLSLILTLKKPGFFNVKLIFFMNNFYKHIFRSRRLKCSSKQVLWKISHYSELERDSNTGVFV